MEEHSDPLFSEAKRRERRKQQNLPWAVGWGLVVLLLGTLIWSILIWWSGFSLGFIALPLGYVLGLTFRWTGRGVDSIFSILAAFEMLLGCVGMLALKATAKFAMESQLTLLEAFSLITWPRLWEWMLPILSPSEGIFCLTAIYLAHRYSRSS